MAETFAGLAGNETVMIRGASLWRGLLITLCSLFDRQLLKTYCLPGAMPALETEEWERQCSCSPGATGMEEWCELRLKTDGKFSLMAAEQKRTGGRESRQVGNSCLNSREKWCKPGLWRVMVDGNGRASWAREKIKEAGPREGSLPTASDCIHPCLAWRW